MFYDALTYTGSGLEKWNIPSVVDTQGMSETFKGTPFSSCKKRQIADAWKSNGVFAATYPSWITEPWCIGARLDNAQFKKASWDWVQNPSVLTHSWGEIGDWDVSDVGDFSYAFSTHRNEAGGSNVNGGNPKAATFVGTEISKWITTSVTTLRDTFVGAVEMNADLSGWKVSRVETLHNTFNRASKFSGKGLDSWDTASVSDLKNTFYQAGEMNSDLSKWNVARATTLFSTFSFASKFAGIGLSSWDTASVTTLDQTFEGASNFSGEGLSSWSVIKVTEMLDTFTAITFSSCIKRQIADSWNPSNYVFRTTYGVFWSKEAWCIGAQLNAAEFKEATWDWVQDTATATTKWGDIGEWDVSGVEDFSRAFSQNRDATGGLEVSGGNPKAATFLGTGMSKWITTSVTSLFGTFYKAGEMNADLSGWKVGNVVALMSTFSGAAKFAGKGLSSWDTSSVTLLDATFTRAREMNSDLSGWSVGKVTRMSYTFFGTSKFVGIGLNSWDTTSVTNLADTFNEASVMNADLSKWSVAKVTDMTKTFMRTYSLTSCNKRRIADAWKSNPIFTDWKTAWTADKCKPPLTDATFKQASWGTWVERE